MSAAERPGVTKEGVFGVLFRSVRSGLSCAAGTVVTVAALAWTGGAVAPPAMADPASSFTAAITAARGASCPPLRYDPTLQRAADIVNRSTEAYFDTTAPVTPADSKPQPMPILKDFGSNASKAILLQGASINGGEAIKGAVVQGFATIPDCSYTDFGTSTIYSEATGYTLVVAVLAGS
jgi:hypothetical protein